MTRLAGFTKLWSFGIFSGRSKLNNVEVRFRGQMVSIAHRISSETG